MRTRTRDERPDDEGLGDAYWRAVQRRSSWGSIAGSLLVLTLLSGAFAWSATVSSPSTGSPLETTPTVIGGADTETTASVEPTGSAEPTSSVVPTAAPDGNGTAVVKRAPFVAYRKDGWLWVMREDGSTQTRVVESASGRFSLSPDGATIAWVDQQAGLLKLVNVADGKAVEVGPAVIGVPSWAPDSSWVAYSGPGPSVRRVDRDGTAGAGLFDGFSPAIALDGETVVALPVPGEPPGIIVWRNGTPSRIPAPEAVSSLACDGRTVYYGLGAPASGTASLHAIQVDGSQDRVLVAAPATSMTSAFADLELSPDGTRLAYAEWGDDQYSRVFVLPVTGGASQPLSSRRDSYTLSWGSTGADLFLIEGNAYQGEPTSLVAVKPDGSGRRLVVEGATR